MIIKQSPNIVKLIKDKNIGGIGKRDRKLIKERLDIEKIAKEYKKSMKN